MIELQGTDKLLMLVGHADVLENRDPVRVLEELRSAIQDAQFQGVVVLASPLPAFYDRQQLCSDFKQHREQIKKFLS